MLLKGKFISDYVGAIIQELWKLRSVKSFRRNNGYDDVQCIIIKALIT
jgi:hypothetical protein